MIYNQADSYFLINKLVSYLSFLSEENYKILSLFSKENEVFVTFGKNENYLFHLQLFFGPYNTVISFPDTLKLSKYHKILFDKIQNSIVDSVNLNHYDRSFTIKTKSDYALLFKLYGGMGNLLLLKENKAVSYLRHQFKTDLERNINEYSGNYDLSESRFLTHFKEKISEQDEVKRLRAFFPVLYGNVVLNLINQGFCEADPKIKWKIFNSALNYLQQPDYYVNSDPFADKAGKHIYLDFYPPSDIKNNLLKSNNLKLALNFHFKTYISNYFFETGRQAETSVLNKEIVKTLKILKKSELKLERLKTERDLKEIADIIMANIHQIDNKKEEIELFDFYRNCNIRIKIDRKIKADVYASNLYRKAKNKIKEVKYLEKQIKNLQINHDQLKNKLLMIRETDSIKTLNRLTKLKKTESKSGNTNEVKKKSGLKSLEYKGFKIRYGKNSKANDELTFRLSHKEDIWLHARDKPGSHVVISMLGKKELPAEILELAASIAALNSGSKHSSLVPVLYAKVKYVRKFKGAKPGQVKLDNFKDILVKPYIHNN